jgi:hypothetical protein
MTWQLGLKSKVPRPSKGQFIMTLTLEKRWIGALGRALLVIARIYQQTGSQKGLADTNSAL